LGVPGQGEKLAAPDHAEARAYLRARSAFVTAAIQAQHVKTAA